MTLALTLSHKPIRLHEIGSFVPFKKGPKRPYVKRQLINKTNTGKVVALTIQTKSAVYTMQIPCTHLSMCEKLNINPDEVTKTGWLLDNSNYVWR